MIETESDAGKETHTNTNICESWQTAFKGSDNALPNRHQEWPCTERHQKLLRL